MRQEGQVESKSRTPSAQTPYPLVSLHDAQLVILVLNTVSPNLLFPLPKLSPLKLWPVLRCSAAGVFAGRTGVRRDGCAVARDR